MNAPNASANSIDPVAARRFATEVVRRLQRAGYQAFWAGGCVRDWLLGFDPKDYDVATSARPEQVRRLFGRRRTIPVGQAFGIVAVVGPRSAGVVEVATFRRDAPYSDGRHPDAVEFSSPEEDARRRDFTINGLFYDPLTEEVIDYVGGQRDLEQCVLRAIGDPDERFSEDWLRMLRAVRFAAAYELKPDPATAEAVRRHAPKITGISPERICAEMLKMLVDPHRRRAAELLQSWQLLPHLLPEATRILETPLWEETLSILEYLEAPNEAAALAALTEKMLPPDSPRPFARRLARRWRLPNRVRDTLTWMFEKLPLLDQLPHVPWSRLQPVVIHPEFPQLASLARARWRTTGRPLEPLSELQAKRSLPPHELDPPPLLTGNDLRQAGWKPGPHFRVVLQRVRAAQLDQQITTRDEALQLAETLRLKLESGESPTLGELN